MILAQQSASGGLDSFLFYFGHISKGVSCSQGVGIDCILFISISRNDMLHFDHAWLTIFNGFVAYTGFASAGQFIVF